MVRRSTPAAWQSEPTVRWTVSSERTAVSIPTEGKPLMAVGGVLLAFGALVWIATGK